MLPTTLIFMTLISPEQALHLLQLLVTGEDENIQLAEQLGQGLSGEANGLDKLLFRYLGFFFQRDLSLSVLVLRQFNTSKSVQLFKQKQLILNSLHTPTSPIVAIPETIRYLSHLERLNIQYTHIQTLPAEIMSLKKLQQLFLNKNKLNHLPPEIGCLENLVYLELDDNQLQTLPESIGFLPKLKYLLVRNNQLKTLPASIGRLSQLVHLQIEGNPIQSLPAEILESKSLNPQIIKQLKEYYTA